ncbi:MAG: prephenate dehydrogenase/arogenate dehydrogenase family protein [Pirellulales bacterium]
MKHWDTVAIVGVGLIGGSIGLDLLRGKLARHVVGIGRRPASLKTARDRGCVNATTTDLAEGVADADLIIVCTPVGRIVADVCSAAASAKPGALITDVGSTKRSIIAGVQGKLPAGVTFVGSHPIAGSEKNGPAAALEGLFVKRTTVVTPAADTPEKATKAIERFWKSLHSRVVRMTPEAHDAALAATSHVPHVVASALAGATPPDILQLTAGGWLDSTRIAAADSQLWLEILTDNRAEVLRSLAEVEGRLAAFRKALETADAAKLTKLLESGKTVREAARKKPKAQVR